MSRTVVAGLKGGMVIGVAGTLFLLAIDGIRLSEAPWFLGSWILLGLFFGVLVHWSYESEKPSRHRSELRGEDGARHRGRAIDVNASRSSTDPQELSYRR